MRLRFFITIFTVCACTLAQGQSLNNGMSKEDVRIEMGHPESKLALGSKEILIYEDGTRLEFIDDSLVKKNDQTLPVKKPKEEESAELGTASEPLLKAEELVQQREETTIGASVKNSQIDSSGNAEKQRNETALGNFQDEMANESYASDLESGLAPGNRIQQLAVTFGVEIVVTLVVLMIAFQISGFPSIFMQLFLLSVAVSLAGAVMDALLGTDPLNPIRSVGGLIVLMILIRQLTDVREWATAIKISLIARFVSFAIIWVVMLGLSMLMGM